MLALSDGGPVCALSFAAICDEIDALAEHEDRGGTGDQPTGLRGG